MATATPASTHLDHFFSSSAARFDRWRELNARAQTWAADARGGNPRGGRAAVEAALVGRAPARGFLRLSRFAADEDTGRTHRRRRRARRRAAGAPRSVARCCPGSYRYESGQWDASDEESDSAPERLAQTFEGGESRRPYFETLFVTPAPAASAAKVAHEIRRLRRVEDAMIYEPVLVGSVEDAILATILNGKIQAVVIYDGIPVPSQHDVPLLRDLLTSYLQLDTSSLAPQRNRRDAGADDQAHPPRARHLSADRPPGRKARGRPGGFDDPARVLRSRGADGGTSQRARRRRRPLLHAALRQSQALRRAADRALSTRCRSRAASRS